MRLPLALHHLGKVHAHMNVWEHTSRCASQTTPDCWRDNTFSLGQVTNV